MAEPAAYPRLVRPPRGSFFLFGVRGVGKTTWVRETFPEAYLVDLLDESRYQQLAANPALLAPELRTVPRDRLVVLDEVQRVPALLNEVQRAVERDRRRFALLGSSARRLKTPGTNLLAGRATVRTMYPLVPAELGTDFDLDRVLSFGSIPLVWRSDDPRATLDAYVNLYIKEEVRGEALARNLPGFLRFLPVAALFHGQVINISGIARDAVTARATVEGYVGILEDTLLATRLPAFAARLRVRERRHPKLYWVDSGIVRAARRDLGPVGTDERGPLFEGFGLTLLRAHAEVSELYDDISYWAPADARVTEVDFVLRRGREQLPIRVKASSRFSNDQLVGLRAIADLPRLTRRVLVYLGERSLKMDDRIDGWPFDRFARTFAEGATWPCTGRVA